LLEVSHCVRNDGHLQNVKGKASRHFERSEKPQAKRANQKIMKQSACKIYIEKQKSKALTNDIPVSANTELIVVIPCYNEPDVKKTLDSLFACDTGDFCTEIILLINSFEISSKEIKELNRKTLAETQEFARLNNNPHLKLIPLFIENLPGHQTGAGQPRKIGMDEALRRFISIDKEDGVIVSLDADCLVDKNYLTEIQKIFYKNKKLLSATIAFHHPIEHLSENDPIRKSIELYEVYLHYYRAALKYTGYPYAYHTVGSAFAVRCTPYSQVGGMGKQQAGEDFYFLQKIFPLGPTVEITKTKVYPAARLSDRVPFGTGPALAKMIAEKEIVKYTYSFESFQMLKSLFDIIDNLFKTSSENVEQKLKSLSPCLTKFLLSDNFIAEIETINKTTSTLSAFRKRFFNYFNAFKILKYLNFVHPDYLEFKEVKQEIPKVL